MTVAKKILLIDDDDDLRKALAPGTRAKVTAELAKDLTNVPLHDLPRYLGDVVRC